MSAINQCACASCYILMSCMCLMSDFATFLLLPCCVRYRNQERHGLLLEAALRPNILLRHHLLLAAFIIHLVHHLVSCTNQLNQVGILFVPLRLCRIYPIYPIYPTYPLYPFGAHLPRLPQRRAHTLYTPCCSIYPLYPVYPCALDIPSLPHIPLYPFGGVNELLPLLLSSACVVFFIR